MYVVLYATGVILAVRKEAKIAIVDIGFDKEVSVECTEMKLGTLMNKAKALTARSFQLQ
jgi:hypothetical protein